jgi:hypothetical protein
MTAATSYVTLDGDDLGANKILRAATMSALDSNPLSIAQRGSGAPWLNGIGAITKLTSGSGNWTVPDGVYRIKATVIGGGGGGDGSSGSGTSGGSTTFGAITCTGGGGGTGSLGSAGSGSGGDVNMSGGVGGSYIGGSTLLGFGGVKPYSGDGTNATGYGSGGGSGGVYGGGAGGCSIAVISVEPGDLIAYSVGSGGTGGTGADTGGNGAGGIIIIEY